MNQKNKILKRIGMLLLIITIFFGLFSMNRDFVMAASIQTIPSNNLKDVYASHALSIGSSTYASSSWNGVHGISEGTDGVYADCKYWKMYVPYNQQDMHLKDFLDIYFTNVGSIGGRTLNAKIHCDALEFTQEAVINSGDYHKDGYMQIINLFYNSTCIVGESAGSVKLRTTVTITYADTGSVVNLPFYQRVEDIDAKMPYINQPESWEGISGFTNTLYVYQPYFTGGVMKIEGMRASACVNSPGASGDDSMLKAGLFAPTVKGTFTCEWGENNCGTTLAVYSAYDDHNQPNPIKETDAAATKKPGDTINYFITQKLDTFYATTFTYYDSFIFEDKIPEEVSYVSADFYDNGIEKTNDYGNLTYDNATRTVRYEVKQSVLKSSTFYDGQDVMLRIRTTARNDGNTVVTAKNKAAVSISGICKSTSEVQTPIKPQFSVTTKISNGTITPSESDIDLGEKRTVSWSPNAGYYVKSVTIDGNVQAVTNDAGDSYSFSNIKADHNVKVVCEPYHQIRTEIINGTITNKITGIKNGENHGITWKAKEGYYVESVSIDGNTQAVKNDVGDSYSFSNVTADHYIKVVCRPYHQIETEVSNGSITEKITGIKNGENHGITWRAKEGYYVESVTIDGNTQAVKNDAGDSYSFSNVTADHYIKVVCRPYYRVETEIDHGTITPVQDRVKEGDRPEIVWTPEAGYYVKTVAVDNIIVYNNNAAKNYDTSYSFSPISENHKVVVKTALIPNLKITKNSDKNVYNYQDTIIYTIVAEQTIKGAIADHVVITDKDITKGIEFDLNTLKVSDPSARVDKNKAGNSFTVKLDQMSDSPVSITVKAIVNNETLESKDIKNTARIISDQTDEIADDSILSIFYKVKTKVTNGSISPNDDKVGRGENRNVSYQPADASYYLESVKIDGEPQNLKDCQDNIKLKGIKANHFVEVIYKKIPDLAVKKSADRNVYSSGEEITYTIVAEQTIKGAVAENVTIYDESLPEGAALIPESVSCDDRMAQIKIEENDFRVTVPQIDSDRKVTVKCKALIAGTKLESDTILNTAEVSFKNAEDVEGSKKASCQIQVRQKILTEVVNGSITDSESEIPLHADREITYQAEKGYYMESVTVDGEKISITDYPECYKFVNICDDHIIRVVYKRLPVYDDPVDKTEMGWQGTESYTKEPENDVPFKSRKIELLTPNPTRAAAPKAALETKQAADTGDQFPLVPISAAFLASFCLAVIIMIRKKQKKEGENKIE